MSYGFLDIAVTPSVRAAQASMGSESIWQDFKGHREFDRFTPDEAAFIAARDSFYMASVSETGWPYVQHRGGPPGFLHVLDERTLGFADYRGNRQYISLGNLLANDRVALILMDYPNRSRMEIYAHVEPRDLNTDAKLATRLAAPDYKGRPSAATCCILKASTGIARNTSCDVSPRTTLRLRSVPCASAWRSLKPRTRSYAQGSLPLKETEHGTGTSTAAALYRPERGLEGSIGRGCLEHARSRARGIGLHAGKHLAEPCRVLAGTECHRRLPDPETATRTRLSPRQGALDFGGHRIAVRFAYEWHDASGNWFRSYGNENWEFDEWGLMHRRLASINDVPIRESERKHHWPPGRKPDEHPSLSDLDL